MLPSEVLAKANTYDLYVMDIALSYQNHEIAKSQNRGVDPNSYSTEDLMDIMFKAQEQTKGKK